METTKPATTSRIYRSRYPERTVLYKAFAQHRAEDQGALVVKPLDRMAGQSVFVTSVDDGNHNVILETVSREGSRFVMLQEYVSEIERSGDHRGNLATGARAEVRPLTDRDHWMCEWPKH